MNHWQDLRRVVLRERGFVRLGDAACWPAHPACRATSTSESKVVLARRCSSTPAAAIEQVIDESLGVLLLFA
jgi:hypothetical protein